MWCFPQNTSLTGDAFHRIQAWQVMLSTEYNSKNVWEKYPDKIEEIETDTKWKKIEHVLGLDHLAPAVQAIVYFLRQFFALV